jgi:hypothetical protein
VRAAYNLNAQTSETSEIVITDGTLAANTSQNGLLGAQLRVKYTSPEIMWAPLSRSTSRPIN